MSNNRYSIGMIIVAIGLILLLGKLGFFGFIWNVFWPILVIAAGALLHLLCMKRRLPHICYVPAGFLVVVGILFFFCTLFGWGMMAYLWPAILLGVAVGLYEYHFFGRAVSTLVFIAAIGLALVSGVLFSITLFAAAGIYFLALALIAVGVYLVMGRRRLR